MLAVSNTSPISSLAAIGRLGLLSAQFSELWIPAGVANELGDHPDPLARAAIEAAIQTRNIQVAPAPHSPLFKALMLNLHRGEAEAIALAATMKADIVVIDEHEGRQLAVQTGLVVTGVLGILLRAVGTGEIKAIRPEIHALRHKARFFISPALEAKIISEAGQ